MGRKATFEPADKQSAGFQIKVFEANINEFGNPESVSVSRQHQTEIANPVTAFPGSSEKLFHFTVGEKVFRVLVNRFVGFSRYFYHSLHYENRRGVFEIVLVTVFIIL